MRIVAHDQVHEQAVTSVTLCNRDLGLLASFTARAIDCPVCAGMLTVPGKVSLIKVPKISPRRY